MKSNTILRLSIKILELISSSILIYFVSRIGTQWILLISLLFVPPFSIYLIIRDRSPSSSSSSHLHSSRRILRIDAIISTSMAILSALLAIILAYSHHVLGLHRDLLHACLFSSILCLLYSIDVFLVFLCIRSAVIHFALLPQPKMIYPPSSLSYPLSLAIDSLSPSYPSSYPSIRLLSIQNGQLKFVPSSPHQSLSIPRVKSSPSNLTRYVCPPPRPNQPIRFSSHIGNFRGQSSYSIPPSITEIPSSSSSFSSLHLGERFNSASTINQEGSDAPLSDHMTDIDLCNKCNLPYPSSRSDLKIQVK